MIIFDLEWNHGYKPRLPDEILQIGAVKVDRLGGRIIDTFNAYIHPVVYKKLYHKAKELPDKDLYLASPLDFPAAYRAFYDWCGQDAEFAGWGTQDVPTLAKSAEYYHLPQLTVKQEYDLQAAFSRTLGVNNCIALEKAAAYCAIPYTFEFHNALHDSLYTALVGEFVKPDCLTVPPAEPTPLAELAPLYQSKALPGPFAEKSLLLGAKAARRVVCPTCKKIYGVSVWHPFDDTVYYSRVKCQEHGRLLCRVDVAPAPGGNWKGTQLVLPELDAETAAYRAAKKHEPILCVKARGYHRRRRGPRGNRGNRSNRGNNRKAG